MLSPPFELAFLATVKFLRKNNKEAAAEAQTASECRPISVHIKSDRRLAAVRLDGAEEMRPIPDLRRVRAAKINTFPYTSLMLTKF